MTEKNILDSHHLKMVTVYASSSAALRPVYYDAARRLGEILALAGKSIIYGAGGGGLMGAMADGALGKDGEVYGVVPGFLQDLELTHRGLTDLKVVGDMRERKHLMLQDSDAVVALPGGSGTYEELFEALTVKRLGQWVGPVVIVNTVGFYDGLLEFLKHSVDECFMGRNHLNMWSVVDEPEQVLEAIENARPWYSDALQYANVTSANA
ncbi:MAG: TIGR00730 family Rossman fold protein [Xanthomonadales bacterium]|nr:TIGR00730 family Rossman fold protein [Xanthomonadales bacterium]